MSALAPTPQYPSAKFVNVGDKIHGVITQPPEDRQARKFGTETLDFWPDGQPVMQTKIVLRAADGIEYAVYAKGKMASAITKAIIAAGAPDLLVGGELSVTFTGTAPSKGGGQPAKLYEATYASPPPSAGDYRDDDEPPF